MKVLTLRIGDARYGLPLRTVARVLPAAALKSVPLTPAWVAGVLDLHGVPVPVIDLSRLAGFAPPAPCFDTRIVLVDYPAAGAPAAGAPAAGAPAAGDPAAGGARPLGLLAEQVLGIAELREDTLASPGVRGAAFLGDVGSAGADMVQLIEPGALLTPAVRALLYQDAKACA